MWSLALSLLKKIDNTAPLDSRNSINIEEKVGSLTSLLFHESITRNISEKIAFYFLVYCVKIGAFQVLIENGGS